MNRKITFIIVMSIICSLGLCSCGIDSTSSISLVQTNGNGLYYDMTDSNKSELRYYDEFTGKSQAVSENCLPFLDSDGRSASFDQDGNLILFDRDENNVYLLQENEIELVTKLDFDSITILDNIDTMGNIYIFEITEDSIYWGFAEIVAGEPEDTDMCLGIYKQNINNPETSIVLEKCYNDYFDVISVIDNNIYIRNYDNQLLTVDMDTGEEELTCESELLSDDNLIAIYEDGMIVFDDHAIYWSNLIDFEFEQIVSLEGYNQFWYGIDRIDNTVYFVVEYDDNGRTKSGIASLDLVSQNLSLYHTFTGWKNRNLHVSDILIGDNGFYYINASQRKMAGGGLYYYNMQDETYTCVAD